jgi:hypothetical protein
LLTDVGKRSCSILSAGRASCATCMDLIRFSWNVYDYLGKHCVDLPAVPGLALAIHVNHVPILLDNAT